MATQRMYNPQEENICLLTYETAEMVTAEMFVVLSDTPLSFTDSYHRQQETEITLAMGSEYKLFHPFRLYADISQAATRTNLATVNRLHSKPATKLLIWSRQRYFLGKFRLVHRQEGEKIRNPWHVRRHSHR